jgi:hypothetical protein
VKAIQQQNQSEERRAIPRTPHAAVVIMAYGEGENLQFETATLIDCSPDGISIQFHRPLSVDQNFLLKLKLERVTLVQYVVKTCTPAGRQFRIGAQFTGYVGAGDDLPTDAAYQALMAS